MLAAFAMYMLIWTSRFAANKTLIIFIAIGSLSAQLLT
jgi:hypothetical protein